MQIVIQVYTLIYLGRFSHEILPCFEHSWINTSFFLSWRKNCANIDVFNFQQTFVSISTIYGYLCRPSKPMPSFKGCLRMGQVEIKGINSSWLSMHESFCLGFNNYPFWVRASFSFCWSFTTLLRFEILFCLTNLLGLGEGVSIWKNYFIYKNYQ